MTVTHPFQTLFAVPMTCGGCVKAVSDALYRLEGITKVEAQLDQQLVSVEGTAAPSAIVDAIQATGKDAILRGSGTSNSAAVSILETYSHSKDTLPVAVPSVDGSWVSPRHVRGLARMVQVSPTTTLIDLTLRGVSPGTYRATIRAFGDLSSGASSTGPVWGSTTDPTSAASDSTEVRGELGTVEVGKDGKGSLLIDRPFQVWETIGHAMAVARQEQGELTNDDDTVVGVIARSAGVWDNDKTVCSCTGKTLWEERKDEVQKGML